MDRVELHDVEYGDCTVLVGQNQQILMGGLAAPSAATPAAVKRRLTAVLTKFSAAMLPAAQRQFLLTHYHRDHMSGFFKASQKGSRLL